jgi:C4-dicarboxylate-specific signal transduction histidine kinase
MARKRKTPVKKKPATRRDLHREVNAVGKQIDTLMSQAKKAEASTRKSAERELRALKRKQTEASRALAKLGRQSAAASEPILAGLQKAWQDMGRAIHLAARRFRETS